MPFATVNPYTGATIKTFPDATDAEVQQAIAAAHDAFSRWKAEAELCAGIFDYYVENAAALLAPQELPYGNREGEPASC